MSGTIAWVAEFPNVIVIAKVVKVICGINLRKPFFCRNFCGEPFSKRITEVKLRVTNACLDERSPFFPSFVTRKGLEWPEEKRALSAIDD